MLGPASPTSGSGSDSGLPDFVSSIGRIEMTLGRPASLTSCPGFARPMTSDASLLGVVATWTLPSIAPAALGSPATVAKT